MEKPSVTMIGATHERPINIGNVVRLRGYSQLSTEHQEEDAEAILKARTPPFEQACRDFVKALSQDRHELGIVVGTAARFTLGRPISGKEITAILNELVNGRTVTLHPPKGVPKHGVIEPAVMNAVTPGFGQKGSGYQIGRNNTDDDLLD